MPAALRRLHPAPPGPTTPREAYGVERPDPPSTPFGPRPWVGLCMIASLDGAVAVDGTSGALGNSNDRDVLLTFRDHADVVLVGAGTASGEGYGPPRTPGLRIGVVTNSGHVDLAAPLFASGSGFVVAPQAADIDESAVDVLRAGRDRLDLALALTELTSMIPGARFVQVEGGPTLNAAFVAGDFVDELNLTISPRVVGSESTRITHQAPAVDQGFDLAHLLVDDEHFVFGRWVRNRH